MSRSKKLKSTEPVAEGEVPVPEDGAVPGPQSERTSIRDDDFLFPKLPGGFHRHQIRKRPLDWLKDRYIQVMNASMGNHSMSLFYCVWTQEQFEEILDEEFAARISRVKNELADRATFIMLRGIGLVDGGDSGKTPPTVTAVMAKVVEGLREKGEKDAPRKGVKLIIEGLDRTVQGGIVNESPKGIDSK